MLFRSLGAARSSCRRSSYLLDSCYFCYQIPNRSSDSGFRYQRSGDWNYRILLQEIAHSLSRDVEYRTNPATHQDSITVKNSHHWSNSLPPNIMGQKPRSSPDVVDFRRHGPQIADSRIVDLKSPQRLLDIWRNRGG
mgnify:CR=1 FL=1